MKKDVGVTDYPRPRKPKIPPLPKKVRKVEKRKIKGKPKILVIADVEGWTGWRKMLETKKHLSDQFDIDITTVKVLSDKYKKFFAEGIELHYDRVRRLGIHGKYDLLYFYLHTSLQQGVIKGLMRETYLKGGRVVAIITQKRILKKHWGKTQKQKEAKFKALSPYIDAYMINNLFVKSDLEKLWDGPIHYVPEGIDLDLFKPLKYDIGEEFVAAYAGKPALDKGLVPIIKPACDVAGVKLITNTNNFTTAIPYEKMVNFYNRANVYVVASRIDGGPNPALEAAACGRPIISNRIGNMPELIKNGVNGYMVKCDVNEYVQKLIELKNNPEKARLMGEQARKSMEKEWSWKYVLNTYEKPALWKILKR